MLIVKRIQFAKLIYDLRHGVYTKNYIALRDFGMRDADLKQLLTTLAKSPCRDNILTLDIGNDTHITPNDFNAVEIKDLPNLNILIFDNTRARSVTLTDLPGLRQLEASRNRMLSLELVNTTGLKIINLAHNYHLQEFVVSKFKQLEKLDLQRTSIKVLDLTGLARLKAVNISNNHLKTLIMTGVSNWTLVTLSSQHLDPVSLNMIMARRSNAINTTTIDTYQPEAGAPALDSTITEDAIAGYFATWLRTFKDTHAQSLLMDASKNLLLLHQLRAKKTPGYQQLPDELLSEIAMSDFHAQTRAYMRASVQSVVRTTEITAIAQNKLVVERFVDQMLPGQIQQLTKQARQKILNNKGLFAAIHRCTQPPKPKSTTQLIVSPKRSLLTRAAVAPLTWMLGIRRSNANTNDNDNAARKVTRRKLKS